MKMNLNDAYTEYLKAPERNQELLGEAILAYCEASFKRSYGSSYYTLGEAISETCLEVWRQLPNYQPDKGKLTSWVSHILERNVIDIIRKYNSHREEGLDDRYYGSRKHRDIEDRLSIKALVSTLSIDDQALVKMKMDGLTDEEVANSFGINKKAAEMRWYRIKETLKFAAKSGESL